MKDVKCIKLSIKNRAFLIATLEYRIKKFEEFLEIEIKYNAMFLEHLDQKIIEIYLEQIRDSKDLIKTLGGLPNEQK